MQQTTSLNTNALPQVTSTQSIGAQIFGALLLGVVMVYGVGFASMDIAHNAAHDARHAIAFPCH